MVVVYHMLFIMFQYNITKGIYTLQIKGVLSCHVEITKLGT